MTTVQKFKPIWTRIRLGGAREVLGPWLQDNLQTSTVPIWSCYISIQISRWRLALYIKILTRWQISGNFPFGHFCLKSIRQSRFNVVLLRPGFNLFQVSTGIWRYLRHYPTTINQSATVSESESKFSNVAGFPRALFWVSSPLLHLDWDLPINRPLAEHTSSCENFVLLDG